MAPAVVPVDEEEIFRAKTIAKYEKLLTVDGILEEIKKKIQVLHRAERPNQNLL